jgi:hypothetical protein
MELQQQLQEDPNKITVHPSHPPPSTSYPLPTSTKHRIYNRINTQIAIISTCDEIITSGVTPHTKVSTKRSIIIWGNNMM